MLLIIQWIVLYVPFDGFVIGPEMVVGFDLCSLSGMLEVGFSDFNVSIALFFDGVVFTM